MYPDNEWYDIRGRSAKQYSLTGHKMLRMALVFGFGAIALTAVLLPVAQNQANRILAANGATQGVDTITTGSVRYNGQYTVRRSILQANPDSVCIIRDNGSRAGDC